MGKKDTENEGIGIVSIVVIVIVAVLGLYYFFSYRHTAAMPEEGNLNVPLQSPAPIPDASVK